jgi:hypothetical protein
LASVEKGLQQGKKDNATLACYINARKEEDRMNGDTQKRRRRNPTRRWRRVKAPRMFGLGGSGPPRVVQGLSLLRPASCYLLFNDFDVVNICWTYVILCRLNNSTSYAYNA